MIRLMTTVAKPKAGLEDTVATSSAICYLDGDRGVLAYCGYDIHDLARHATFEEVCYLLWHRRLPTRAELGDLQSQLVAARPLPEPVLRLMRALPAGNTHGRAADAHLGARPLRSRRRRQLAAGQLSQGGPADRADQLAGRDAWGGLNKGGGPIQPDPVLSHAANFLYMLTGERPSGAGDARVRRRADPACRPRAERVDVRGARRGRHAHRHPLGDRRRDRRVEGAAARRRQRRRHAAAARDRRRTRRRRRPKRSCARSWRARRRFPGFGHRVYHTEDPRATHLREMSRDLGERAGQPIWFEMSQRIEALVKAEKKLNANVDFYSASTYHSLGIDIDLFTPIFAVSRVSGWTAHVLEQYANNRLIRPRAEYIGPEYPQRYQPLDAR